MRSTLASAATALRLFTMFTLAATVRAQGTIDPALLAPLKWRSIGPVNTSGRIDDFSVGRVHGQPDQLWVATASGGVFKSTNAGTSWDPVFDRMDAMMSIGAIRVAPSNASVVWVGTGEANNRQSSSWGDGVYKTTDAGKTWKNMGLKETRSIARIVIDPGNYDIVYVAAAGHLWGSNAERGVFKTTDGGQTWKQMLYVDDNTGATDLVIDPMNPLILYAAMYQHQRKAWGFNGGGPGSAIYKTIDGGTTWTKLTKGLPEGDKGRIGIDLLPSDSRVVYATVEAAAANSGVYRTLDGGANWEKMSTLNTRPMYYSQIRLDPKDRNRIYMLGSNRGFYFSDDAGKTFTERFSNIHSEDHALWVDPDDPNHLIVGGDGGVSITWDRAVTWDFRRNMPIGQFYEVDVDSKVPYTVCGGLQDNGLWCVPSAVRNRNGIADRDSWNIGGGDGFYAKIDPFDPNFAYEESQDGNVARVNLTTMEHQPVRPGSGERAAPDAGRGGGSGLRFNWDSPIVSSNFDSKTVYMGANRLFKSTDRASSWRAISPDLTLHIDRDTLTMMGAKVGPAALSRHDGVTSYGTITSVMESPMNANVIYAGTDDGQVQLTRDGGTTWTNVTAHIPGLPARTPVTTVIASRFAAGRAYATFDGHYNDDYKPYVYVSDDFGQSWRAIVSGLPETSINRIREHPHNSNVLVLAHSRGVHFSNDGGASWNSLATNMPTVPTDDAIIHPRDNALIVGTHGRSIWILDDVGPLEALTRDAVTAAAVLAPIPRARLLSTWSPQAWYGHGEFFAPNPAFDGVITYYLRDSATGPVSVEISDAATGAAVRTLKGTTLKGLNRVSWDLRVSPAISEEEAATVISGGGGRGGGRGGGGQSGPLVLPGRYRVLVKIPGVANELRGEMLVEGDPLTSFSDADRRSRQAIVMNVFAMQKTIAAAHSAARALGAQVPVLKSDLAGGGAQADSLIARIGRLQADVDRSLTATNGALRPIEVWSGMPTIDQRRQIDYAIEDANKAIAELNHVIQVEIPAMYSSAAHKPWPKPVAAVGSGKK